MRGNTTSIALLTVTVGAFPAAAADLSALASVQGATDSNVYRLPADLKAQFGKNSSDRSLTAEAILLLDLSRNNLRIQGHAAAQRTIFARNKDLNNLGYDFGLSLKHQQAISSITVDAGSVRRLTSYQDVRSTARSIQTLSTVSGSATRAILGDFRLIAGGDFSRSTNTDPLVAVNDYQRYGVRVGFGYYSPAGNIAAIEAHLTRSRGLESQAFVLNGAPIGYRSSYDERSIEGHLLYQPSILLQFEGRLGIARHTDKSGLNQNFSGVIGAATAQWSPRDTLQFSIVANRSFQTTSAILSNGVRASTLKIGGLTQVTSSLSISADYKQAWRNFLVGPLFNQLAPAHKERIGTAEADLTYSPAGRYSLSFHAERSKRDSAQQNYRYNETIVTATLALRFGANAFDPVPISGQ